jgi:hypothetical protein
MVVSQVMTWLKPVSELRAFSPLLFAVVTHHLACILQYMRAHLCPIPPFRTVTRATFIPLTAFTTLTKSVRALATCSA